MATRKTGNRITVILQDTGLPWLLSNLRQDIVVWKALNDPAFVEKVVQAKPAQTADFSPGHLALIALNQPDLASMVVRQPLASVDDQVIQMAIQSIDERASLGAAAQDLASAGLVAISWLNKYISTNSWQGLLQAVQEHPHQNWKVHIACLYGLLEHPGELLQSLVYPGASPEQVELAVHAILSNPLTRPDQVHLLVDCCHAESGAPLPASDRLLLLQALSEQQPQIALEFCKKWLAMYPCLPLQTTACPRRPANQVSYLLENLFQLEVTHLTGEIAESAGLLQDELSISHGLYIRLLSHYLERKMGQMSENMGRSVAADIFNRVVKLKELDPSLNAGGPGQAELASILADQGLVDEARKLLPEEAEILPEDAETLFAIAKVALLDGDEKRSWLAASKILSLLDEKSAFHKTMLWGTGLSLASLGRLLLAIHHASEAAQVLERALHICPNDASLLKMLAEAYESAQVAQKVTQTLETLVSLNPDDLDFRRAFARSLEAVGDWDDSLEERVNILQRSQAAGTPHSLQDKYDYVHCAIMANQPRLALETCTEILDQNPEDSQALIYSGKAYLSMNETDKGMELLARATQIEPHRPETWIALVEAQKHICAFETLVETLKNASQAVPGSAQLHFVLGDLFLLENQPTQALPELQAAVELLPQEPQYLIRYAEALQLLGHDTASLEMFTRAYQLEPNFPGLALTYARSLMDLGRLEDAIAPYETLIDSTAVREPGPYLDYARCVLALNRQGSASHPPLKALIALNQVLQLDPDHAEAKALTAEALTANGEYELAFRAYREALETSLADDQGWFERLSFGFGCVASSLGKQDVAIAALQEASQVNPSNPAIFIALSDAYIAAILPEDAMRAARTVLVIDGENPDNLAWFAHQVARLGGSKKSESLYLDPAMSKELISEASAALAKAIQLAPTRADLVVQLGNFQSSIGEPSAAQMTFASIASLDFATVDDLRSASSYLSEIGDHISAISCLERAILIDRSATQKHDPSLYTSLAGAYLKNNDPATAINTLDDALDLIPGESSLIRSKVDILLGLAQPVESLNVIEMALPNISDGQEKVDLLFLASHITRSMGNFVDCIRYLRMAAASGISKTSNLSSLQLPFQHYLYLAEIYRALLEPEQAYQILQEQPHAARSDFIHEQDYYEFIFLHTELALETGERIRPDIQDIKLEVSHPGFIRLMAINARLMNKAGNYKQAEQLFQLAFNKIIPPEPPANQPDWSTAFSAHANLIAVIEAAQDLGLWDQSMTCAQRLAELAPDEPYSPLTLARTLVLRAEFSQLCHVFQAEHHLPSVDSQPVDTYDLCRRYLDQVNATQLPYRNESVVTDHRVNDDQIRRWQDRAGIIFSQTAGFELDPGEILARSATPGDTAALINYLRQTATCNPDGDALTQIIKFAHAFPRNPSVILLVSLALQDSNPQEALKSLQSVLEHNPYARNPTIAFCNILLAQIGLAIGENKIAQEAVEKAISYWPDEPGWHRLAARIYQQTRATLDTIHHLEEACRLAPEDIPSYIDLGKVLFDTANDDEDVLLQSAACFENALALDPENVPVLVHLATVQYCLRRFDQAEGHACQALALAPGREDVYQLRGQIAFEKNDFQAAYDFASKALQINPADTQSMLMIARALSAMGRHSEALVKLNAMIPLVQDARHLYLERVSISRKINGPQVALNELKTLAASYPDDFSILNTLSRSYYEVGELENAVTVAQKALKTQVEQAPPHELSNLHLLIGQALRHTGQLDQSVQHLSEAIQLAPNRLEAYLELGLARKERREYSQALQIFERATVIAPDDPRAPFQAGLALKESKDYKSSEMMLRRAVSLAPNDINIRRQLAAVVALNLIHNPRSARINA